MLLEAAASGAPFIYGGNLAPFDMRTGRRAGGAIENALADAGYAQVSKHLGLPVFVSMYSTSNQPGDQALLEKPFFLIPFANADIIDGCGSIEDGKTFSHEQQVIDAELAEMFSRITQGIEVNDATLAVDVIDKVKPGGTFLGEKHTRDHLTKEHFIPSLIKRQIFDAWIKDGSKSIVMLAREKAKKLIRDHTVTPLERNVDEEVTGILKEAEREFAPK